MTGPGVPALIARLLTEPDLLRALERRDIATLRRNLPAEPADLAAVAALDGTALRHYLRMLQRKRLDGIEPIFPASLPAARQRWGADALAAEFWQWHPLPASVPAHRMTAEVATAWTGFTGLLARHGPFDWLGDLSRYELLRWEAVSLAVPPPRRPDGDRPVLAPGAALATFAVDVPLLLRTALAGEPNAVPETTRLVLWGEPAGGIRTVRLGPAAYRALLACDGDRTIDQIGSTVAAGRADAASRVAAGLWDLVRAGALRASAAEVPAEGQDADPV